MDHYKLIKTFLEERRKLEEIPETGFPFVTISRQPGAGGHLLAYVLLTDFIKYPEDELLQGWHVFDRELCELVAKDPDLEDSVQALLRERYGSEWRDFVESLFMGHSPQYMVYRKTFQVVRMLAALGKVIIVGRAGSCVTRDFDKGVHVRLVAPEPKRVVWMMTRFKLCKDEARRAIAEQDADRRRLLKLFFNRDIGDPLLYDTVMNTGSMDMRDISHCIIEIIRKRSERRLHEAGAEAPSCADRLMPFL